MSTRTEFERESSTYMSRGQVFARPFKRKRIVRIRDPRYFVTKFRECMYAPSKEADFQKFKRI